MPVLHPLSSLDVLVGRAVDTASEPEPLQVVCSWPLSGQYGGGSRILYYVLVAACVLARKTEWLRNACLAAALILPATAAIHAIVLASFHSDEAVDMDIYGALQLCSIGILTAPATVRLSKTYFNNPGRNVLFVWTVLVVAGLLALTVEFFRTESKVCRNGEGQPIGPIDGFPDKQINITCGLICEEGKPYNPMRTGTADDVNLVPRPYHLTFGAATLVAAASCVPGILSMVSIWNKIAKLNWNKQFGAHDADEVIEGTNGATEKGMKSVNEVIRRLLSVVELPVFGGAVLALIIVGELNFWSPPLHFRIEPFENIGQWSSIVASVFAAIGSLYMLLAKYLEKAEEESIEDPLSHYRCTCDHTNCSSRPNSLSDRPETASPHHVPTRIPDTGPRASRHDTEPTHMLSPYRTETFPNADDADNGLGIYQVDSHTSAGSNIRGVTGALVRMVTALERVSPERFDDEAAFKRGKVTGFPEIPGEQFRHERLPQIKRQWGEPSVDPEDCLAAPRGRRSRANSFSGSISRSSSIGSRAHSPQPPARRSTTGPGPLMLGLPTTHSPETTSESIFPSRPSAELEHPKSQGTVVTLHEGPNSPAIVLSVDDDSNDAPESPTAPPIIETRPPIHREQRHSNKCPDPASISLQRRRRVRYRKPRRLVRGDMGAGRGRPGMF
ncbi:hypothetical protein C7999DRAFT_43997 [Corynascus novoguineensis]|uniref:Uncharacterized protein n=1 Tax=Corynascus novoguineensis TaxID=1126955 RepID=A0AAN7CLI1_9PEZI|nr:hypothetical protein C7999DRAFT_43997 [Corynascus novoguineensis]